MNNICGAGRKATDNQLQLQRWTQSTYDQRPTPNNQVKGRTQSYKIHREAQSIKSQDKRNAPKCYEIYEWRQDPGVTNKKKTDVERLKKKKGDA